MLVAAGAECVETSGVRAGGHCAFVVAADAIYAGGVDALQRDFVPNAECQAAVLVGLAGTSGRERVAYTSTGAELAIGCATVDTLATTGCERRVRLARLERRW